ADSVPVSSEVAEKDVAERNEKAAAEFRRNGLAGLQKSIRKEIEPPFIPIALFGDEEIHDPITHARVGGYWNLMANYIIGTRILDGEQEKWLPHYLETHGGLCMGLTRSGAVPRT